MDGGGYRRRPDLVQGRKDSRPSETILAPFTASMKLPNNSLTRLNRSGSGRTPDENDSSQLCPGLSCGQALGISTQRREIMKPTYARRAYAKKTPTGIAFMFEMACKTDIIISIYDTTASDFLRDLYYTLRRSTIDMMTLSDINGR